MSSRRREKHLHFLFMWLFVTLCGKWIVVEKGRKEKKTANVKKWNDYYYGNVNAAAAKNAHRKNKILENEKKKNQIHGHFKGSISLTNAMPCVICFDVFMCAPPSNCFPSILENITTTNAEWLLCASWINQCTGREMHLLWKSSRVNERERAYSSTCTEKVQRCWLYELLLFFTEV